MNQADTLLIRFTTDGEGRVRASLGGVAQDIANVDRQSSLATATVGKLGGALAGLVGVGALTHIARSIIDSTANYQRLNAALVTVTGSADTAQRAFDQLKAFAATTPFQLNEVVEAFIKLKARGLDPSEAALRSYGNTAGATGKTLDQVIEAVGDAATGEFERLKEFGIVARAQGEQIQFTFQGVRTTVQREAASIEGYLRSLGEVQFAGGMERQADTLGGALSNAEDAVVDLAASIGNSLSPMLIQLTRDATGATGQVALLVRWLDRAASGNTELNRKGEGGWMRGLSALLTSVGPGAGIGISRSLAAEQADAETTMGKYEQRLRDLAEAQEVWNGRLERSRALIADGFVLPSIREAETAKLAEAETRLAAIGAELEQMRADGPVVWVDPVNARSAAEAEQAANRLTDAEQKLIDKLTEKAATEGLSKSATLEYAKAQDVAAATSASAKQAIGEQYDILIRKARAEEAATAATNANTATNKAAAAAARERAKMERESAEVIARMVDDFEAGDAAAARFEERIEALLDPLKAVRLEYEAQREALLEERRLRTGNAAGIAEVDAALNKLDRTYAGHRRSVEAQHEPAQQLIDDLEFELKLLEMTNAEREAAIALRRLDGAATPEQEQQIKDLFASRAIAEAQQAQWDQWRAQGEDAIADIMQTMVSSFKKGGGGFADGLGDAVSAQLDQAFSQAIGNFAQQLGGLASGQAGVTGQSVSAAGGTAALAAAGAIGASYVGGTSSMGQSVLGGAAAGAAYGTMIMPGIGTIVGAILGAIVGFVAHQDPILEVSSSSRGINHGRVEGTSQSAFGDIFVGKDDLTLAGNMSSQELADRIADFDDAIASFLTGAEIQAARDALRDFDFNQRGHGLGPAEVLAARLEEVIDAIEPQWARFLGGISDLQQRVEALQGLRAMRDQLVPLEDLIDSIGGDPFEQLRFSLRELMRGVDEAMVEFDAAITERDPMAIAQTSSELSNAIIRRYQAELQMLEKLATALAQVEQQTRAFNFDIAQRIAGVGGSTQAVVDVAAANMASLRTSVETATNTEQALAHLGEFVSTVDQWLQSSRANVRAWYDEQMAMLTTRLGVLDEEVAGINAAAALRAQAEAAYTAQVQAAQNAAIEAERARLQSLLGIAQQWVSVLDEAQSLIDELTRGDANPTGAAGRMSMLDAELARLRAAYAGAAPGDRAGLAAELTALLGDRLELAQQMYDRPSGEYLSIYNQTLRELGEIRDAAEDPAAQALELQRQLNALQQGTTDAVVSFAGQSASFTEAELARLDEIEQERAAIAEAQRVLDEELAARMAALDEEARAYYEWAQTAGQALQQQQHDELLAALEEITGGVPVQEYIAQLQERTVDALEHIRDSMETFLDLATSTLIGAGPNPDGPPGGPSIPRPPTRPRDDNTPVTGALVVRLGDVHVTAAPGDDAAALGAQVMRVIEGQAAQVASIVRTQLRTA
jgi:hypothetical protein